MMTLFFISWFFLTDFPRQGPSGESFGRESRSLSGLLGGQWEEGQGVTVGFGNMESLGTLARAVLGSGEDGC